MNSYGREETQFHLFRISMLDGHRFTSREMAHGIEWIRGSVGLRSGVGVLEK